MRTGLPSSWKLQAHMCNFVDGKKIHVMIRGNLKRHDHFL